MVTLLMRGLYAMPNSRHDVPRRTKDSLNLSKHGSAISKSCMMMPGMMANECSIIRSMFSQTKGHA